MAFLIMGVVLCLCCWAICSGGDNDPEWYDEDWIEE